MFSPRIVAVVAVLATVAALPTDKSLPKPITSIDDGDIDDSQWFSFPLFGNLFTPLWNLFPSFAEINPKIIADDNKFQVIVNVKDYKKDDLKVKLKGDFIIVHGSHEAKQDDHDIFASHFFHTYTLPVNSSATDVTAELSSDGYLIVTAPINGDGEKAKDVDREVPISESGVPFQKGESTTPVPLTTEAEDDKKEPTTQSDREEVTEKDNVIPHGNEIQP